MVLQLFPSVYLEFNTVYSWWKPCKQIFISLYFSRYIIRIMIFYICFRSVFNRSNVRLSNSLICKWVKLIAGVFSKLKCLSSLQMFLVMIVIVHVTTLTTNTIYLDPLFASICWFHKIDAWIHWSIYSLYKGLRVKKNSRLLSYWRWK